MANETILGGQRVIPDKLMRHGFVFRHPDLRPMLRHILGHRKAHKTKWLSGLEAEKTS